jgi:phosphoenolpyruvate---glycerone phosphotransferase subunit DhaL
VPKSSLSYEDVLAWVQAYASTIAENKEHLTRLDSAIGDADHGINMDRGMSAALAKLNGLENGDVGTLLKTVGMALISSVGGAGGPLYGTLFLQMGTATAGKNELEPDDWRAALEAALAGVQMRGRAEPGDKTMVDALMPGKDKLEEALSEGADFADALRRSAAAAEEGMRATVPLVARKGRASYLGERSAGHQDPGATSTYLLLKTAADTWAD